LRNCASVPILTLATGIPPVLIRRRELDTWRHPSHETMPIVAASGPVKKPYASYPTSYAMKRSLAIVGPVTDAASRPSAEVAHA
jgi:hypothetical protein